MERVIAVKKAHREFGPWGQNMLQNKATPGLWFPSHCGRHATGIKGAV
jgi:hypothetical protein